MCDRDSIEGVRVRVRCRICSHDEEVTTPYGMTAETDLQCTNCEFHAAEVQEYLDGVPVDEYDDEGMEEVDLSDDTAGVFVVVVYCGRCKDKYLGRVTPDVDPDAPIECPVCRIKSAGIVEFLKPGVYRWDSDGDFEGEL